MEEIMERLRAMRHARTASRRGHPIAPDIIVHTTTIPSTMTETRQPTLLGAGSRTIRTPVWYLGSRLEQASEVYSR